MSALTRRFRACNLALLVTLGTAATAAQPSLWTRTREPRGASAERLLRRAEQILSDARESPGGFVTELRAERRTLRMLEAAGAERLGDPRLDYLLGSLYGQIGIERYEDARRLLARALEQSPSDPRAGPALFELGVACAKLGEARCEVDAYTRALDRIWQARLRANTLLNRAEAFMVLGDLRSSVADYRAAAAFAGDVELYALAEYGLAVALDRSGDLPASLDAVSRARQVWPQQLSFSAIDLPSVFFVPEYDIFYYKGIEALAVARERERVGDREGRARALESASGYFPEYLAAAEPARHPWVENARRHVRWSRAELAKITISAGARAR